jgi:CheY-like chemotaxis protein
MKTKTILLVEDDYVDVTSVKRALAKLNIKHRLHVAHNGVDALAILNGDSTGSKVLPDIILLDLNMPKMNGLEFLGIIKNYYSLKNIKVFVMTTSAEEYDIVATQQLGVAGYILKPLDFDRIKKDRYSDAVQSLKEELLSDHLRMHIPVLFPAAANTWAGWKAKIAALKKGAAAFQYFGTAKIASLSAAAVLTATVVSQTLVRQPAAEPRVPVIRRAGLPKLARPDTVTEVQLLVKNEKTPAQHKKPRVLPQKAEESPAAPVPVINPHPIKIGVIEEEETPEAGMEGNGSGEEAGGQWTKARE